jgi:hypothetical protein
MKDIISILNDQICEIESFGYATPESGQRIIESLGGSFNIKIDSNTQAVCVYMTALAIKKMFELNNE